MLALKNKIHGFAIFITSCAYACLVETSLYYSVLSGGLYRPEICRAIWLHISASLHFIYFRLPDVFFFSDFPTGLPKFLTTVAWVINGACTVYNVRDLCSSGEEGTSHLPPPHCNISL